LIASASINRDGGFGRRFLFIREWLSAIKGIGMVWV
jgi:hypothetical protein